MDEFTFPLIKFLKSIKYISPRTAPSLVCYNELDPDSAFMLTWARCSLFPCVSASKISQEEIQFLVCLMKGVEHESRWHIVSSYL